MTTNQILIISKLHPLINGLLTLVSLIFLMRIILSWYPKIKMSEGVWKIPYILTEPTLKIIRIVFPPIGGVDITPVILFGVISLLRELVVGQQGVLTQVLNNAQNLT